MEIPVGVEVLLLIFADGHGRDLAAVVSHEPLPQFRRQATTEFAFGHLDPRFLHGERHGRKKTTRLLLSLAMAIRSYGCCFVARKPPPTPTSTRCSTPLPLSDDGFGTAEEREAVRDLEQRIEKAVAEIGGEHDGDEFGGGEVMLRRLGPRSVRGLVIRGASSRW